MAFADVYCVVAVHGDGTRRPLVDGLSRHVAEGLKEFLLEQSPGCDIVVEPDSDALPEGDVTPTRRTR